MLKIKLLVVLFYFLQQSLINATIFQFIRDVYMDNNYRCATIIVDNKDTIDHQARGMIKTDHISSYYLLKLVNYILLFNYELNKYLAVILL